MSGHKPKDPFVYASAQTCVCYTLPGLTAGGDVYNKTGESSQGSDDSRYTRGGQSGHSLPPFLPSIGTVPQYSTSVFIHFLPRRTARMNDWPCSACFVCLRSAVGLFSLLSRTFVRNILPHSLLSYVLTGYTVPDTFLVVRVLCHACHMSCACVQG